MKYLIASDIHGSNFYTVKLLKIFKEEKANILVLLGDIYNHGPRNPLPEDYAPLKVAEKLNAIKEKILVVKGNCDSQVDTMISDFDFVEEVVLLSGGKTVLCTHGHVYNKDKKPKTKFDAVVYGHFHTGFIEKIDDVVFANAGSMSLPKNRTPNSFIILESGEMFLKDLDKNILSQIKL